MRPSKEFNVHAVLDTLPECKVVLDALEDSTVPNPSVGPTAGEFLNSTGVRFRQQTQYEPRPPHASAYVELQWLPKPEFKVEEQDVEFVKDAARRTLEQRGTILRVFNCATRRTQAARTILNFFEPDIS